MRRIDTDWPGGIGWIGNPDEVMERASHAINGEKGYWLVDPVNAGEVADLIPDQIAGVVVCFDHHRRDAAMIATQHDVSVHLPDELDNLASSIDAPTGPIDPFRQDTGWTTHVIRDWYGWREVALRAPGGDTVRIPESLGTAKYFRAPGERLGVHPMARLMPPRDPLSTIAADRVLVGHGEGVMSDGTAHIDEAIGHARRRLPQAYTRALLSVPAVVRDLLR